MLEMDEEDNIVGAIYERKLIRRLSLLEAVMIGLGASIGAGIFATIGLVVWEAGIGSVVTFTLCGVATFLVGYSYAKLSSLFPESGASYAYVAQGFKHPFIVFVTGSTLWFAYVIACSTYAVGFANYFNYLLAWNNRIIANFLLEVNGMHIPSSFLNEVLISTHSKKLLIIMLSVLFTGLNIIGVSETGKTQTILVVGKLLILIFFIAIGLFEGLTRPKLGFVSYQPEVIASQLYTYYIPLIFSLKNPLWTSLSAVAMIFIAFEGFDLIPTTGEELKNPKVIGKAIFITILSILVIYTLTLLSLMMLVPWYNTGGSEAPLAEAMRNTWLGGWGEVILAIGGVLSTASAFNATLFGASRLMYAMARDNVFPKKLSTLSKRGHIPYMSILMTACASTLLALTENLELVASVTSVSFMLIFMLVSASNLKLRSKTKCKPVIPVAAIVLLLLFLVSVKVYIITAFALWLGVVSLIYYFTRRRGELGRRNA